MSKLRGSSFSYRPLQEFALSSKKQRWNVFSYHQTSKVLFPTADGSVLQVKGTSLGCSWEYQSPATRVLFTGVLRVLSSLRPPYLRGLCGNAEEAPGKLAQGLARFPPQGNLLSKTLQHPSDHRQPISV